MLLVLLSTCLTWQCTANVAADYHKIDRKLIYAIIMTESSGRMLIKPSKTRDYGIAQINKVNINDYRIYVDYKFNIMRAVELLKQHKRKGFRTCTFNIGTKRPLSAGRLKACMIYTSKLKKHGYLSKY